MCLLRRIVVVSKKAALQDAAQEAAQEVFVADDLREAAEIAATAAPDLIVFDDTFDPGQIHDYLESSAGPSRVVVALHDGAGGEDEYRQAGVTHCLIGEENYRRLPDLAAEIRRGAPEAPANAANADFFLDETAAAAGLVGHSPALRQTLRMVKLVAASQCNPVLIVGETGTGKEVAARAVHLLRHPGQPFVAVNCAALTATLLESELFGHVKGAFTGAERDKTGLLELAGAGVIFLDEISEMPLELQAKLLRVLQERTFRRVGGTKDTACQATVIASSNRDLKKEVREKRFRQDLYYRLNICPIVLAPLRCPERREDIPLLAQHFLRTSTICTAQQSHIRSITSLALEALGRHDWPGNVRELRNVIERGILLETTDKIGLSSIIIDPIENSETPGYSAGGHARDFSLEKAERELIARALHETGWQKTQAAALLGITRATLYAKVKQYDIHKHQRGTGATESIAPRPAEAELAVAL
jgi:DNA-binding NtrC family response regulator